MGKVIQRIMLVDGTSLFIVAFNLETNMIKFRTSFEPEYLQEEEIKIIEKDTMVKLNLYLFPISYLQKFINENNIS